MPKVTSPLSGPAALVADASSAFAAESGTRGFLATAAKRQPLIASVARVAAVEDAAIEEMFRLFAANYDDVTDEVFRRDLAAKSHVVLVHDGDGTLRGFSTLVIWEMERADGRIRLLFSGDTVIDPRFWGDRAFPVKWLETIGAAYAREPSVPLYWLLISMSPRTYRVLPIFFDRYHPCAETDPSLAALADEVGRTFFAERFDPSRRLILAGPLTGRMTPELAEVPDKDSWRPEVRFFLAQNPSYDRGDEIVCLARIHPENIRAGVRRFFERGAADSSILD